MFYAVISIKGLNYKKIHDTIQLIDVLFFYGRSPGAGRTGIYPRVEDETQLAWSAGRFKAPGFQNGSVLQPMNINWKKP